MSALSHKGRRWTCWGLGLSTAYLTLLSISALFDDGKVATDWVETTVWLALATLPTVLAVVGLRYPTALLVAGLITFPLALVSFGSLVPLVPSAICYLVAYGTPPAVREERPA